MSREIAAKKKVLDDLMAEMDKTSADKLRPKAPDNKFEDQAALKKEEGTHTDAELLKSDEHSFNSGESDPCPQDEDGTLNPEVDKVLDTPNPSNTKGLQDMAEDEQEVKSKSKSGRGSIGSQMKRMIKNLPQ